MAEKNIVSYIRSALLRGGDANSVRIALLKSGYPPEQVEAAFREAQRIDVHHHFHFSPPLIGLMVAVLIAALGFGYFIYSSNAVGKPSALLDLNLEPLQVSAAPGEELIVLKEVTNMGSLRGFDVELQTDLVDPKTGSIAASKTETRAIETIGSTQTRLLVPAKTLPGEYILRTIAEYSGKRAVASLRVTVTPNTIQENTRETLGNDQEGDNKSEQVKNNQEEGAGQNSEPKECNDSNPCTIDSSREGKCAFEPFAPCCGNGLCEQDEFCMADCPNQNALEATPGLKQSVTLDEIRFTATTDPKKAMQECAKQEIPDYRDSCFSSVAKVSKDSNSCAPIINERIKDVCFSEVAKVALDSSICGNVVREERKDSCYLSFVLDYKDYSVCEKIVNENLRQSCNALKGLS